VNNSNSQLKNKIKDVLNESRILVLGTQVLLGFQFQAVFYPGFARLAPGSRWANFASLVFELLVLALLLAPAPFHRITENGDDTIALKHLAARAIGAALPLFACSLGLDVALVSVSTIGAGGAAAVGGGIFLIALTMWVAMGILNHRDGNEAHPRQEASSLQEKIETLLTEARVILPGVQALLGFQFAAMLTDKFQTLPHSLRIVHTISLLLMAIAIILLVAPAAYHRLAADGTARRDVDLFGAWAVLGSLAPLSLGLAGDLYVVANIQEISSAWSAAIAVAAIALFACVWGLLPVFARNEGRKR